MNRIRRATGVARVLIIALVLAAYPVVLFLASVMFLSGVGITRIVTALFLLFSALMMVAVELDRDTTKHQDDRCLP